MKTLSFILLLSVVVLGDELIAGMCLDEIASLPNGGIIAGNTNQLKLLYPTPSASNAIIHPYYEHKGEFDFITNCFPGNTTPKGNLGPNANTNIYHIVTNSYSIIASFANLQPSTNTTRSEFDITLDCMHGVETYYGKYKKHDDGVSIGPFGLTMMAMRQLFKLKLIDRMPTIEEMKDYHTARRLAGLYLTAMKTQFKCKTWRGAAGFYHNQSSEKIRDIYRAELDKHRR